MTTADSNAASTDQASKRLADRLQSPGKNWKELYAALLWASLCYLVRCAYRVAEYANGPFSAVARHEVYFYCLDTLPLFLGTVGWVRFWPQRYIDALEDVTSKAPSEQRGSVGTLIELNA